MLPCQPEWNESFPSGPVAQLGARFHGMEEVIGSIPIRSTNHFNNLADVLSGAWQHFGSKSQKCFRTRLRQSSSLLLPKRSRPS